jgi:hypothetical protein
MGITNTVANISGFLGPYVAGVLINGNVRSRNIFVEESFFRDTN